MAYNKFITKDGTVMLDLTDTTVSAKTLGKDITAVDKHGNKIIGTLTGSSIPIEVSTEEEMATLLETGEVGSIYKYTGITGTYENGALYELTEETDQLKGTWVFNDTISFDVLGQATFSFTTGTDSLIEWNLFEADKWTGRLYYDNTQVYRGGRVWDNQEYRTINITSTIDEVTVSYDFEDSAAFLSWLQSNATKQSSRTFAKLIVPMGTLEIVENGKYDVSNYTNANVSIKDSPMPIEVSTEVEMTELLTSGEVGGVYKYIGSTGTYENGALYLLEDEDETYLTFSSPNSFTLNVVDNKKYWDGTLEYSTDLNTWSEWDGTTTLSADNGKLYMRGTGNTYITGENGSNTKAHWVLKGRDISCSGNIESLLDYTTVASERHPTMANHCYHYMFYDCSNLKTPPELPATTLANYCYSNMFSGCTGLTTAPELPATTLANYCYSRMFDFCISLTTAPELPATTLTNDCYSNMFHKCINLKTAPELPATTLASNCYYGMFYNCISLTTAPELPATTLAQSCYYRMFWGCSSLIKAPELPATTMADNCYNSMFYGCSSLTTAPELPATTLEEWCYAHMFSGCTSLTTAPELPATTLYSNCYDNMFRDCTSLTTAPKLPATTLTDSCYRSMFIGCSSLTTAPELPATTLAEGCYAYMFNGCSSLKLSTTQTGNYTIAYRIPTSGTGTTATDALLYMFSATGGTFTGTPTINTTYYLHSSNSIV